MNRPGRLEQAGTGALLALTLVLPCLLGYATTYLLLALAILAALHLRTRPDGVLWVFDPAAKAFLAAFAVLALLFALTAKTPLDVLSAFNFAAFLLYVPMATMFDRAAAPGNARRVALLALLGAAIGFAVCILEVFALGFERAGVGINDSIRLANTAVILGIVAPVMGFPGKPEHSRWIFLLGPLLALATVLLTGARIAMIAFPVLVFVGALLIMRRKWLGLLAGLVVLALLLVAGLNDFFGNERLASLVSTIRELMSGKSVADETVRIRLELYKAGWQAFQQSPFIGHGWANMMSAAGSFLPEADKVQAELPHLHNELLTFAVAGGLVGVALCVVLIAMPVVIAWRSPRDGQYLQRLNGSIVLSAAYAIMGLTDTMLSFELHTALFVALTAMLLRYCRDPEPAQ